MLKVDVLYLMLIEMINNKLVLSNKLSVKFKTKYEKAFFYLCCKLLFIEKQIILNLVVIISMYKSMYVNL